MSGHVKGGPDKVTICPAGPPIPMRPLASLAHLSPPLSDVGRAERTAGSSPESREGPCRRFMSKSEVPRATPSSVSAGLNTTFSDYLRRFWSLHFEFHIHCSPYVATSTVNTAVLRRNLSKTHKTLINDSLNTYFY